MQSGQSARQRLKNSLNIGDRNHSFSFPLKILSPKSLKSKNTSVNLNAISSDKKDDPDMFSPKLLTENDGDLLKSSNVNHLPKICNL